MNITNPITRIITHKNCPDGVASAMICRDVFPAAEVEFVQYGEPEREELRVTEGMLFVDMTPPEHLVDACVAAGAYVLDHHRGARDVVERFGARGVFADETERPGIAGANLAYEEVLVPDLQETVGLLRHREAVERFARLAGIRDTWQKDLPDWHEACAQAAVLTFFSPERWMSGLDGVVETRYPRYPTDEDMLVGYRLLEQRAEAVERAAEKAFWYKTASGHSVAVFADPDRLTSDVAERLRADGVAVTAGFSFRDAYHFSVSLRSDGTVDVSRIAKVLGGGGHTRAAGFGHELRSDDEQPYVLVARLLAGAGL